MNHRTGHVTKEMSSPANVCIWVTGLQPRRGRPPPGHCPQMSDSGDCSLSCCPGVNMNLIISAQVLTIITQHLLHTPRQGLDH